MTGSTGQRRDKEKCKWSVRERLKEIQMNRRDTQVAAISAHQGSPGKYVDFFFFYKKRLWSSGSQSRVLGPTVSAAPKNFLEKQILRSHPRLTQLEVLGLGPSKNIVS